MAEQVVDVYDQMPFGQAFAAARAKGVQQFPWRGGWYSTEVAQPGQPQQLATPQSVATPVNPYTLGPPAGGTMQPGELAMPQSTATPVNPFSLMPSAGGGPPPAPQAPDFIDLVAQRSPPVNQAAPSQSVDMGFTPPGAAPTTPMLGGSGSLGPVNVTGQSPTPGGDMSTMGAPIPGNTPAPGVGDSMMRMFPQEAQVGPAKTPQEAEARVNGWKQFIDKATANPNLMLSLLKFGTEMMQPVQPGQTAAGHIGRSVQGGADYWSTLLNQESVRALQAAEAQRFGAGTEQIQRQTAAGLPEAQAKAVQVGAEHTLAQSRLVDENVKLAQVETRLKSLDADSRPEFIAAQMKKLKADGVLDEAKAAEVQAELDAGKPAAAVDLLKAHAEYWRQQHKQAQSQITRYNDLVDAFMQPPYSMTKPQAVIEASKHMYAAGAMRGTAEEDADQQIQGMRTLYAASQADPKNKRKGQTFEQFVKDELDYSALPPATKALILSRMGRQAAQGAPPPAGAAPPPAAAPTPGTYGTQIPAPQAAPGGFTVKNGKRIPPIGYRMGDFEFVGGDPDTQEAWKKWR